MWKLFLPTPVRELVWYLNGSRIYVGGSDFFLYRGWDPRDTGGAGVADAKTI